MYLTQSLHRSLQQSPDQIMTICGDRVRTVTESVDRIARLAGALLTLGVEPGDRVGILSLNSDRYHEYLYAVPWAGAVVNPVNIRWSPAEVAYSLKDSDTTVLLVDDAFAAMLPALHQEWDGIRTVIFAGDGVGPAGSLDYEELIAGAVAVEDVRRRGSDLYGIFYTGGTTGFPKGVMLSHDNMMISAMGGLATLDVITRGGRNLHAAPMFHLADLAMWNMSMLVGATQVMVPMFTPVGVVKAIEEHQVNNVLLVPTMIQMLVDSPETAEADLSSVEGIFYGASPISEALLERAAKSFPSAGFTQGYGMTELAPIATMLSPADHADPKLRRAAGRGAAHVEIRIVDPEDNEIARGDVGEIVVRGDNVMLGYWKKPEETATTLRGGWMHTGDGGRMDENGYVFIVDRIKDMIVTGGENVYSAEVENALSSHPAVAVAAVIGVPDPQWGERVHAVIVLQPGQVATSEDIREHCKALIAGYKVPKTWELRTDPLPVSGAGKPLKRELRS